MEWRTSLFIEYYLRYKTLSAMAHHNLSLKNPVDFGRDYIHLTQFVQEEKHLSNPYVDQWGIEKLRNAVINEGLFFKAARSRPVKNYFSPPFSGLPLTRKKDEAEETIFMTHDMMHHLIPDLVCDQTAEKKYFYVYSAWRMISEACTLVLADMFYADSLIQNGVERTCVDKRIYPLFEAIKVCQKWSNPDDMSDEDKVVVLKQLLFANVRYALLGDDLEWQRLLSNEQGDILPEHMEKLDAYKRHFEKFFIGDHAWTRANFENMHKHADRLQQSIDFVGRKTFVQAGIPLLSATCEKLESNKVNFEHYDEITNAVFNLVFKTRIEPRLLRDKVEFNGNLASSLDVARAKFLLAGTESKQLDVEAERQVVEQSIAALLNISPSTFKIEPVRVFNIPKMSIPKVLPAELLERRPDIAVLERKMAQANKSIGIARAAFFPDINLNGSSSLFLLTKISNPVWAFGSILDYNIFESGYRRAQLMRTWSAYRETLNQYREGVVNAFKEVEHGLSKTNLTDKSLGRQKEAVAAAFHMQELTMDLFQGKLASSLDLLYAELKTLEARIHEVEIKMNLMVSTVYLVKSLGGGWEQKTQMPEDKEIPVFGLFQYTKLGDIEPVVDIGKSDPENHVNLIGGY